MHLDQSGRRLTHTLDVDLRKAAQRIFNNQRKDEDRKANAGEVYKMLKERVEQTERRYEKYYGISFLQKSNYDIVLDTTNLTIEQAVERIVKEIKN